MSVRNFEGSCRVSIAVTATVIICALSRGTYAAENAWIRQIGTSSQDVARNIAVHRDGSVYVTGTTQGSLIGARATNNDPFLRKYDRNGAVIWTRQMDLTVTPTGEGINLDDYGYGLALDSQGNAFISGYSHRAYMPGSTNQTDALMIKYESDGTLSWTRRFDFGYDDMFWAACIDPTGGVYAAGRTTGTGGVLAAGTYNGLVTKYTPSGDLAWTREISSYAFDDAVGIAADKRGDVVVVGTTKGELAGPNINQGLYSPFIRKFSADGDVIWTRQIQSFSGAAYGIAFDDAGNLFVAGASGPDATSNAFVCKFSEDGTQIWARHMGGPYQDVASSIAVDHEGNILIAGSAAKNSAFSAHRDFDAYLSKLNGNGDILWTKSFGGASGDEHGYGVAVDGQRAAYLSGEGFGLGGIPLGGYDGFIAKVVEVPEPSDFSLMACALTILLDPRLARRIAST